MAPPSLKRALVLIPILLTACAVRSPIWSATGELGPPMATDSPTTIVRQCDVVNVALFPPGNGSCGHAFQSKNGMRITFSEVATEVEGGLGNAIELRPHLRDYSKQFQPDPKRWVKHQRYKLYLVGLRPAVVVGVPVSMSESDHCYAPGGTKCYHIEDPKGRSGRAFSGWSSGLHYSESPRVIPGSFVFVPASGSESTQLPISTPRVGVPNTSSVLVNTDGFWKLQY